LKHTTVERWVGDISKNAQTHFFKIFNRCVCCLSNADESVDITSSSIEVHIFACGIPSDFEVFQEVVELSSLEGKTKGSDFTRHYYVVFRNIIWN
jgi:hypothetical protein